MIIRIGLSMILGVIITTALFYLMQSLIAGGKSAMTKNESIHLVDFVHVQKQEHVETKQTRPEKPPPPEAPPKAVKQSFNQVSVNNSGYSMSSNVDMNVKVDVGGGGFGISDGEYLPIVKVQPMYPQRALSRGMSGWVIVRFTVTKQGTVSDPVVVENCGWIQGPRSKGECKDSPNSIFDSAATRAALKFKYKPQVINGEPVDTAGVENKITFKLVGNSNG